MAGDTNQDEKYSIDTCSLINGYADRTKRSILENLIRRDRIKSPPSVLQELQVGGDNVFDWVKNWKDYLIRELSAISASHLGRLVKSYGEPFPDPNHPGQYYRGIIKKGTAADADPDIIGLAIDYGWTVVSEEASGIKGACKLEKIKCISLQELCDIEITKREQQLRFM